MRIKTNTKIDNIINNQLYDFLMHKKVVGMNKRQSAGLDNTTKSYTTTLKEFEDVFAKLYNMSEEDLAKHDFCTLSYNAVSLYSQYIYSEVKNKACTHNRKLDTLRAFITYLIKTYKRKMTREQVYDLRDLKDEIAELDIPEEKEEKAFFTKEDIIKLHSTIINGNLKNKEEMLALFLLYRDTSDRRDEIRFMNLNDIHIRDGEEPYVITSAKNKGMTFKKHYLRADTVQALKAYIHLRKPKDPNDPALFISTHGKRFSTNTIYNKFKELYVAAGFGYYNEDGKAVSKFATHSLRHSVLTEVIFQAGMAEAKIMAGHSSVKVTERYMHVTEEQKIQIRDTTFNYNLDAPTERQVD